MSLFITFEGGEGSGKSTQAKAFYRKVLKLELPAILIREPGGTALGDRVRFLLKQSNKVLISPVTELMLFNASRSQLVHEVIKSNLKEGRIVICDRFADSSVAYQHFGRGINFELVTEVNASLARD
jgi:dTMP kinase